MLLVSVWYHLLGLVALVLPFLKKKSARKFGTRSQRELEVIALPVTYPTIRADSAFLERLNASVYRQFLLRQVLRGNDDDTVAIFQNPFWGTVIERGDCSAICYDCLDDVSIYTGSALLDRFLDYEQQLIAKADVIITTAAKLEAHLRVRTSKPIYRIPNGVDYDWFQKQALNALMPDDVRDLKRPIVGYVGSLSGWIDYELIGAVASKMPDVSFVFVGPFDSSERMKQLQTFPNIHWLGRKPYGEVPKYIKAFDVCTIPFKKGSIAETTNPVKIFEYFALGKPVVSSPLDELRPFSKEELVFIGDSAESFATGLRSALNDADEHRRISRMRIASNNSWQAHAESFIRAIQTPDSSS